MKKCVGLLGISGQYGDISRHDQRVALNYILENFDFIDTASVYGQDWLVNPVLAEVAGDAKKTLPKLMNKIGANLLGEASLDPLIEEYEHQKAIFADYPVHLLMLHRPSMSLLQRDSAFYSYIRQAGYSGRFGICTNSIDVLSTYHQEMKCDVVQAAINLLDYSANIPFLDFCKKSGVSVHARSVMSSGMLSGKYHYSIDFNFADPFRTRFTENQEKRDVLRKRLNKTGEIKTFYEKNVASNGAISFAQFVYDLTASSPAIDLVIKGGSTLEQLTDNSADIACFDQDLIDHVFNDCCLQWQAPY